MTVGASRNNRRAVGRPRCDAKAPTEHPGGGQSAIDERLGCSGDESGLHLAVAERAGQIKAGGPCRGGRIAKYDRLLRIEEELGDEALYAGRGSFAKHSSVPVRV
jgi:enolase